jgi:hypothetical protein
MRLPDDEDFRYAYGYTADIDPGARRMVSVGQGKVVVWNIGDAAKVTRSFPAVRGDIEILGRPAPGLAYDFHARTMVAWAGGTDIFTVEADEANALVTREPAGPANRVTAAALAAADKRHLRALPLRACEERVHRRQRHRPQRLSLPAHGGRRRPRRLPGGDGTAAGASTARRRRGRRSART